MASSSSSPHISTFLSSTFQSKSYTYMSLRMSLRTIITLPSPRFSFSPIIIPPKKSFLFRDPPQRNNRVAPILAVAAEDVLPLEAAVVDATNQVVTSNDDGVSIVISALLFVAFIGLSVITIGVIYLGVTDFLQKREKEKFEKEEATKGGKKKKKVAVRARAGPRGFGQKIEEDKDDD